MLVCPHYVSPDAIEMSYHFERFSDFDSKRI